MLDEDRQIETFHLTWNGILVQVSYEHKWLNLTLKGHAVSHIQIESMQPSGAPLPITETGYKSHFTSPEAIESYGGPVAFATAWLDDAAKSPKWKAAHVASKQLTLF